MAEDADIRACLGDQAAQYAANKHRGGSGGNKGTRYEDYFIVCKVVEAAVALLDDPTASNPIVQSQVYGFVDDVRIADASGTGYFQLKNKGTASWTAGTHPLVTDFAHQAALATYLGEPSPYTNLVLSSAELAAAMLNDIPDMIRHHTNVLYFPWYSTFNRHVLEHDELRQQLAKLATTDNAPNDVLTGILGALLMACLVKPEGATILELLTEANRMFPSQLRLMPAEQNWEHYLLDDFHSVLAKVEGLVYGAKRGFFYWSGFGTSGVFGSNVLSDEFKEFQNDIVQFKPKTFEEFEKFLP